MRTIRIYGWGMESQELKSAGLKTTEQRTKILSILEQLEPHHFSAEDIYQYLIEQDEKLSLATIYRVLNQFHTAGIVTRHNFAEGQAVFELNKGEHHDHLVCVKCSAVIEFFDATIEKQQLLIAKQVGFTVLEHAHTLYGLCKKCKKINKY
jgi:Fur family ferric uptake transcriptional regulator